MPKPDHVLHPRNRPGATLNLEKSATRSPFAWWLFWDDWRFLTTPKNQTWGLCPLIFELTPTSCWSPYHHSKELQHLLLLHPLCLLQLGSMTSLGLSMCPILRLHFSLQQWTSNGVSWTWCHLVLLLIPWRNSLRNWEGTLISTAHLLSPSSCRTQILLSTCRLCPLGKSVPYFWHPMPLVGRSLCICAPSFLSTFVAPNSAGYSVILVVLAWWC